MRGAASSPTPEHRSGSPVSSLSRRTSDTRLERPDTGRLSPESAQHYPGDNGAQASLINRAAYAHGTPTQSGAYKPVATSDQNPSSVSNRKGSGTAVATIFADCAVILLPLAVIVFIVLVWCLDGSLVGDSHSTWQNAINVLATAFPILFASVVGRLMSEWARWKLEKGETVGLLEQLMGSRTVGSTVITLFQLRTLNLVAALLLLVWAFSPLGAQAILRMLDSSLRADTQATSITYFDTKAPPARQIASQQGSDWADGLSRPILASLATLYTILVATPQANKVDSMDLWGNVRIPYLPLDAPDTWMDVSEDSTKVEYSSLAGVPVHYGAGNATFTLESNYIHLACPNATKFPAADLARPGTARPAKANVTTDFLVEEYSNGTWRGYEYQRRDTTTQWGIAIDRFVIVDLVWLTNNTSGAANWSDVAYYPETGSPTIFTTDQAGIDVGPTKLMLRLLLARGQVTKKNRDSIQITCDMTQQYVESQVSCLHAGGQLLNTYLTLSLVSGLTHLTCGPEILGYVSTTIRSSRFIDVSRAFGHNLDGRRAACE